MSDSNRDPRQTGEMPFLQHLDELRRVLTHVIAAGLIGAIVGWMLAPRVMDDLIQRTVGRAVVLSPLEALNERFKLALLIGLMIVAPYAFYRIWRFIVPGLLKRERSMILPMALAWLRVHHSAPLGPAVISEGMLPAGSGNSSIPPSRLIRPIRSAATRVYQSVRPGPAHNPYGEPAGVSTGTEETTPAGSVLPIRPSPRLNQIASSGPRASTIGRLCAVSRRI